MPDVGAPGYGSGMHRRLAAVLAGAVLVAGCGGGPEGTGIRAVSGDMDCAEVAEVIGEAIARGGRFVAGQESDTLLAGDLIFALSGAEERPECIDDAVRSRAEGLRATLNGTTR